MSIPQTEMFKKCDELGESKVRENLNANYWSDKIKRTHAQEWLRLKEEGRSKELAAIRDERENRTLSIAEEANRIASSALTLTKAEARLARRSRWIDRIIPAIAIIIAAIAARDDIK